MEDKKINFNKLIDNLKKKWNSGVCPMCGSSKWSISETIYELREFHGGDLVLGRENVYPIIPVMCSNCGNAIMVNALIAGVIKREDFEDDEK